MARWYNLQTHDFALSVFLEHPSVRAEKKRNNKTIDLFIDGEAFDVKLSVWPKKLIGKVLADTEFIQWFNKQQSYTRQHHKGKIFIVVADETNPELSWKVKREFGLIRNSINAWLKTPAYSVINETPFGLIKVFKEC